MTEQQNLIMAICEESYKPLQEASLKGSEDYRSYLIDCATLEDFNEIDVCEDIKHKPMFDELLSFKCPVLYWFEIVNPELNEKIIKAINKYKRRGVRKATPAMRKTPNLDTNVLYVGKVKKGFTGRVITHLGYYKVPRTQGLQLYHWSTGIELKLKLHVYTFKPELAPLMTVIERGIAEKLRPLLGSHK
jgi:hypothetical protein